MERHLLKFRFINLTEGNQIVLGDLVIDHKLALPVLEFDFRQAQKSSGLDLNLIARGIALLLARDPNYKDADKYLQILRADNNKLAEYLKKYATQMAAEGAFALARDIYQVLLRLFPEDKEINYNLALAVKKMADGLHRDQAYDSALKAAQQAATLFEKVLAEYEELKGFALYHLGGLYRYLGKINEAKDAWQLALPLLEEKYQKEIEIGLNEIEQLELAQQQFADGVKAIQAGKLDEGILALRTLAQKFPEWWNVHYYLGLAYLQNEEPAKAVKSLEQAHKLRERDTMILNQLGLAYFRCGELAKAKEVLEKAIWINPADPGTLCNMGLVEKTLGNLQQAAEYFYRAYDINWNDPFVLNYIAQLPEEYRRRPS